MPRSRALCLSLALTAFMLQVPAVAGPVRDVLQVPGRWVDDRGRDFDLASLKGSQTIITMAYGACRRVCSASLRIMKDLQARADQRALPIHFVVVGLEPENDRPEDWARWRADNGLARTNWTFLSGEPAATRLMAQRLGLRYWRYGDHTLHDLRIVLLSPDAQPLRAIEYADQGPEVLLP